MGEKIDFNSGQFRIFRMASSEPSFSNVTDTVRQFEYNPDYPRSSTPFLTNTDVVIYTQWSFKAAAYRIFYEYLQKPPIRRTVRGLQNAPSDFLAGHLIPPKTNCDNSFNSFDLITTNASIFTKFLHSLKKCLGKLFRKCFKKFMKSRCDANICDLDCECRTVKDILNKRIEIEEEG